MIKKLIYLIAILFLIVPNAVAFMGPAVAGGGMPGGGEEDPCTTESGVVILGDDTQDGDRGFGTGNMYYIGPFTASDDCPISELKMDFSDYVADSPPQYVRLGIYADDGQTPNHPTGDPIRSGSQGVVSATTATSTITTWTPTEGTIYWIAMMVSGDGFRGYKSTAATGACYYQSGAYHATNPFPTEALDGDWTHVLTVWGEAD